jgi:transposase
MDMAKPWMIDDELWVRIEALLPVHRPGNRGPVPLDDRRCLQGILFVLYTGINWKHLPPELGFGSGTTCWRRFRRWCEAGVWDALHRSLLADLHALGEIDWSAVCLDGSHIRAREPAPHRSTAAVPARSTTSPAIRPESRSRSSLPAETPRISKSPRIWLRPSGRSRDVSAGPAAGPTPFWPTAATTQPLSGNGCMTSASPRSSHSADARRSSDSAASAGSSNRPSRISTSSNASPYAGTATCSCTRASLNSLPHSSAGGACGEPGEHCFSAIA